MFPPSQPSPFPPLSRRRRRQPPANEKRIRFRTAVTALLAAAAVGATTAAVVTATLDSSSGQDDGHPERDGHERAADVLASSSLSVNGVWTRAKNSVVDIKVQTTSQLGQTGRGPGLGLRLLQDRLHRHERPRRQRRVLGHASTSRTAAPTRRPSSAPTRRPTSRSSRSMRPPSLLKPLAIGNSSQLVVGDPVVAVGSPFGLDDTVTAGIVSALHRQIDAPNNFTINDAIQTDAAINHGNSGGPLFNLRGEVVGVNAQIQSDSGDNAGIGFAIPSNTVKSIADQLISKRQRASTPTSASRSPRSPRRWRAQLGEAAGVAVQVTIPGQPAAKAGLKAATGNRALDGQQYPTGGDVITAIDGQSVSSAAELQSLIDAHRPGDKVRLTVTRNGSSRTRDGHARNEARSGLVAPPLNPPLKVRRAQAGPPFPLERPDADARGRHRLPRPRRAGRGGVADAGRERQQRPPSGVGRRRDDLSAHRPAGLRRRHRIDGRRAVAALRQQPDLQRRRPEPLLRERRHPVGLGLGAVRRPRHRARRRAPGRGRADRVQRRRPARALHRRPRPDRLLAHAGRARHRRDLAAPAAQHGEQLHRRVERLRHDARAAHLAPRRRPAPPHADGYLPRSTRARPRPRRRWTSSARSPATPGRRWSPATCGRTRTSRSRRSRR